jgi:hypothetical protein
VTSPGTPFNWDMYLSRIEPAQQPAGEGMRWPGPPGWPFDRGIDPAVQALFLDDPHRDGSVDAVLLNQRVHLNASTQPPLYGHPICPVDYTRDSRPALEAAVASAIGDAFHPVQKAVALTRFCARLSSLNAPSSEPYISDGTGDPAGTLCGGTEEELLTHGCPLASERARLLCALANVAGIHAHITFLASIDPPERHTVTEMFIGGRWSLFDGWSGRFYPWSKHGYASAWDIKQLPGLIDNHPDHRRQRYVASRFFQYVAIAPYDIARADSYSFERDPIPPALADRLRQGFGG